MAEKSVLEDIKYDEGQSNLSEAQIQAIAQEALKESKDEKKDDWKNPADEQTQENADDKSQQEASDQAKKDAEAKEQEEKDKQAKDDADLKAKEQADQKAKDDAQAIKDKELAEAGDKDAKARLEASDKAKAELLSKSKADDKPFAIPAENRSKLIEELALKESLTLDEAEEQIVKDEALVNKYKNNPVEMARAMRHLQRDGDKAKAELEATRKAGNTPPAAVTKNVDEYVESQLEPIKDKVIESYKKEYPKLTENQSDEYVYELIKKDAKDQVHKVMQANQDKLVSAAKEKRANLIMALSDQDKAFLPDIKAIIDRTNDRQIMAKDYDIKYVIEWAKGKQYEKSVKEAEERGYKRGMEQSKIIGEKLPGGDNNKDKGGSTAKKIVLSELQKERALNMFDIPQMSDQDKFDAYVYTYPEEFKKEGVKK